MKVSTRQRILDQAVQLFNENGFASVTLFQIAGSLNMTRGNLTYHFKDKDNLLIAISDEFWAKLDIEKNKTRLFPSFENLHNEVQLFYSFQKRYSFFFMDYHVINHHAIRQKFKDAMQKNVKEIKATIAFAISAGNMHPEPYEGMYHHLAFNTWMVSFYWLNQQMFRINEAEESSKDGEMKIWSMLLPHLTEKGLKAFRKFFGDDYLKKMGESFNPDIAEYVRF